MVADVRETGETGQGRGGPKSRKGHLVGEGMQGRNWVLAAMIFAVAMTFIDQTIVSIAVPNIQRELGLTSTGVQWVVNAYLIALAALFALGGRLSDIYGHTRLCVIGVIVFVGASVMCGLTPKGSFAEVWIVGFRAVQGAGGALMFPAALAIVVNTFPSASGARRWRCSSALPAASLRWDRSWAGISPSGPGGPSSGSTSPWRSSRWRSSPCRSRRPSTGAPRSTTEAPC